MPRLTRLILLLLAIVLTGCPLPLGDADPNTPPTTSGGSGSGSGGGSGGGDTGGDSDGVVGPPAPGSDEPNEPAAPATNDLTVTVNAFDTFEPISSAVVTVRTGGLLSPVVCTEVTGFAGQVTCPDLEVGVYQVTATFTDSLGFPVSGSQQVVVTEGPLPAGANVLIGP